jgi:outer membrane protein TolC
MRFHFLLGLGAALALAPRAEADEPGSDGSGSSAGPVPEVRSAHVYGLRRCLELAEENYPKVHEARAKLGRKQAELSEAHTAPFSDFTLSSGIGPAPTVRGTALYSPNTDVTLSSNMALAWQVGVSGTVPLWTFGKIGHLWEAAEANVKVGEHEVQKEKNDVKLAVRRAYYGTQLARDSRALMREAMQRIDKHVKVLARKVAEGEGDDIQLLKARMYRAELTARESEASKLERTALSGLRFLTGARGEFDIPDQPLRKVPSPLRPLPIYLAAARLHRPEVNMARAGVMARAAKLALERSRFYPDIGLGLSWTWARAPEVADQKNPFVRDPANYNYYGFQFGLRWKLDFLPQAARLGQARADLDQMRATERYALGAVGVDVEQAFEEASDAARRVEAYGQAARFARQWLVKVQQGIDVGTSDDEDIIDPAKEYALKRFAVMNATLDYNLAMARLAMATGWDEVVPD